MGCGGVGVVKRSFRREMVIVSVGFVRRMTSQRLALEANLEFGKTHISKCLTIFQLKDISQVFDQLVIFLNI